MRIILTSIIVVAATWLSLKIAGDLAAVTEIPNMPYPMKTVMSE